MAEPAPDQPFASRLMRRLSQRGYIHQTTDGPALDALALAAEAGEAPPIAAYIGFDATAPSLHVGSLVQIMMLRHLQQAGHKPVVLMGGGTTRVGDPSGRDTSRAMLDDAGIAANIASIRTVFERFLTFGDGPSDAVMVNNADWLDRLGYVELLREVGPHFTINRMLTFDSVRLRLEREAPMTFLEFNYMILQAYDFLHLSRHHDVRLQMGGSDQWGNIVNGIELARRMDGTRLHGLTTPLMTTAAGAKMGKTAAGAVWLNPDQLSDFDYWQYWRNTDDRDVGRFLRLFTDLPLEEIAGLEGADGAAINAAKARLATEATALCRGEEAAARAGAAAAASFGGGGGGGAPGGAPGGAGDLPTLALPADGMSILDALVASGLVPSKKEGRRKIAEGAVKLDGAGIDTDQRVLGAGDADAVLALGKRRVRLVG